MSKISDIFFIKTILDRATAGSYNGQSGYYSVSNNMFSEGHSCYCDNGGDWYNDLKGIFNCDSTLSGSNWSSSAQIEFDAGHYNMTIVKMAANNYLSLLIGGQTINLNFDGNYYYTQDHYASYGGTLYRFDYINGEIVYNTTYLGGSFATVSENVETTLFSSASIMMYYSGADRNVNYAKINSEQGIGSGGWQVPNPNPTRKIVINGSEPDDIKLNGATPKKIMLNGQCYFEKAEPVYLYKWDFTKSLTDEVAGKNVTLYNNATRDNSGAHINGAGQQLYFESLYMIGKTIEIDVSYFDFQGGSNGTATFLLNNRDPDATYKRLSGSFIYFGTNGWGSRGWIGENSVNMNTGMLESYYGSSLGVNDISGKTIKVEYLDSHTQKAYIDDQLIGTINNVYLNNYGGNHTCEYLWIGGWGNSTDTCYNMTITGVRIYENEE